MDIEKQKRKLDEIPADRRLIDVLHAHGNIDAVGREYALSMLYPHDQWGLWASRLLLGVGAALILSGILYFFAFNWAAMTPMIKFGVIQLGVIGCVLMAARLSLKTMGGQIFLIGASVLVGIFMAVFGQIYQTGADAYQLFMMWAVFIFGWTVVSKFAMQWVLWGVVVNTFLLCWWAQVVGPHHIMGEVLSIVLALVNGAALICCERFAIKGHDWLRIKWMRPALLCIVVLSFGQPVLELIFDKYNVKPIQYIMALVGFAGHVVIFAYYRWKMPDMRALTLVVLSITIMAECFMARVLLDNIFRSSDGIGFLFMGLLTLGVFTASIVYLRKISSSMEVSDV